LTPNLGAEMGSVVRPVGRSRCHPLDARPLMGGTRLLKCLFIIALMMPLGYTGFF